MRTYIHRIIDMQVCEVGELHECPQRWPSGVDEGEFFEQRRIHRVLPGIPRLCLHMRAKRHKLVLRGKYLSIFEQPLPFPPLVNICRSFSPKTLSPQHTKVAKPCLPHTALLIARIGTKKTLNNCMQAAAPPLTLLWA